MCLGQGFGNLIQQLGQLGPRQGNAGMMPQGMGSMMNRPPAMGVQGLMSGPYGKPPGKEDNGSHPPEISNPGVTNIPGMYGNPNNIGNPASPGTPPVTSTGTPNPTAPQAGATIPYSAQSYNQPFSPFQNFNQQAQSAFNPMAQTNVGDYGRFNPMTWQGIAGPWPQLFGGPGAPAQQSMGTAQSGGMTAPQQALNAQFAQFYGRPRGL